MNPQWYFNPLFVPMALSVLLILGLIALGIRYRRNPVAMPYLFFMVCLLIWMSTSALEIITLDLELSLLWADLSFWGTAFMPVGWLGTVMVYLGKGKQLSNRLPLLLIVPVLTNIVIWTNTWHGWWRSEPYRDFVAGNLSITSYNYGIWFYFVHLPFSLFLTFLAMWMLIRSVYFEQPLYRKQILMMLFALNLPLIFEILHRLGISPIPNYNISTLVFPISGLILGWALFRFQLLDVTPIARDRVIESLDDLMLVLDTNHCVLDMNPIARACLFPDEKLVLGRRIDDLLPDQEAFLASIKRHQSAEEVSVFHFGEWRDYAMRISAIRYPSGFIFGYVLLLNDITMKKRTEDALYQQSRNMTILKERQRLAQELHDSVNQTLFSAGMMVDLLPQAAKNKPERLPEYIFNIQQLIHGATAQMRLILLELHPDALTKTDLAVSIKHLCLAYTGDTGTPVETHLANNICLPAETQVAFYRIAQEALHNIRKHTEATQVVLRLTEDSNRVMLEVHDNGGGFVPEDVEGGHFGLMTMSERAKDAGADFAIKSTLHEGTTITVIWENV